MTTITINRCDGCNKRFKRADDAIVLDLRTDAGAYIQYHVCYPCALVLSGTDDASAALNERVMATARKRHNNGVLAA